MAEVVDGNAPSAVDAGVSHIFANLSITRLMGDI